VYASPSRARATASDCTHTNPAPALSASPISAFHRCPVGSHATVSPANPARAAWPAAHASSPPNWCAFAFTILRDSTRPW
jgi:hypothetical protein